MTKDTFILIILSILMIGSLWAWGYNKTVVQFNEKERDEEDGML